MLRKIILIFVMIIFTTQLFADKYHDLADKYWAEAQKLKKQGKYAEAAEMYKKSAEAEKKSKNPRKADLATELNAAGYMYFQIGHYDDAIDHFKQALKIDKELKNQRGIARDLNNIGSVYQSWGKYDKSIDHFKQALKIAKELGNQEYIAGSLNNIGVVYKSWGKYDQAIDHYKQALKIDKELKNQSDIAISLNNIGLVYNSWGKYDQAVDHYKQALKIDKELKNQRGIAGSLSSIGSVYQSWGKYDKAIDYFKQALKIGKELKNQSGIALRLNNIGVVYWKLKKYKKAARYFNQSIAIKEKLRLTATGDVRRDYLASQITTYQLLISTYIRDKKADKAFNVSELSKAKYLVEQMSEKLSEKNFKFSGIKNYQKKLDQKTAIINYSNVDRYKISQLVVTKNRIDGQEIDKAPLIKSFSKQQLKDVEQNYQRLRGFKVKKGKPGIRKVVHLESKDKKKSDDQFEKIINYYRTLLSKDNLKKSEIKKMRHISKLLYNLLIKPVEKQIKGKKHLVIIPDGILGFLPFETLIDSKGKYLIEKYHISYTQSLTVSEIIAKRKYSKNRKPLLAFGGAVYEYQQSEIVNDKASDLLSKLRVTSEHELKQVKKITQVTLKQRGSLRSAYRALGHYVWSNLPGTLKEVNALKKIYPESKVFTGKDVTETRVKMMSRKGELKKYKVIHFATHGLVVPEMPKLSAVVLSQVRNNQSNNDGYLTMNEIVSLNLGSDFVNLSACETGLGKIYGGEGVVGLTQSFLIAGSNGLSVSLWQVGDESTMIFMTGVYKLVKNKRLGYGEAITQMKRKFIKGQKYHLPFFWAPFVYYGK